MFVKQGGVWKVPRKIYAKDGGVWKPVKSIYVRSSGTWVEDMLVPSNVVLLYTNMPTTGYVCDGTNGTPNLINKALAISDTPLQVGGNNTHTGADHGTITFSISATYAAAGCNPDSYSGGASNAFSSSSSPFIHSHSNITTSSSGTCDLRLPGKALIPIIGQLEVEPNCLFLRANTVSSQYLAYLADYVAKYLYLASASADVSYTNTVYHANFYPTTSSFSIVLGTSPYNTGNGGNPNTHSHSMLLYVQHDSPLPLTKTYIPYQTTQMISWRDVPSGSLIFVTDNNLPAGYSWVSFSNPTLVKADSSSGSVVGSATHTHTTVTAPTGGTSTSGSSLVGQSSGPYYTFYQSHAYYHHNYSATMSSANTMPAYITLRLAVKN
jgi:hypothetical protein